MNFAVDKINDGIAVLENIKTGEIINVDTGILPSDTKEKDILMYNGNNYELNANEKIDRIRFLQEKMNKLRGEADEYK